MGGDDQRDEDGGPPAPGDPGEGVVAERLATFLGATVSTDAASVARVVLARRRDGGDGRIRRDVLRGEAGLGDGAEAAERLAAVERGMLDLLGFAMLDEHDEDLASKGPDHRGRHAWFKDDDEAGSTALVSKAFARLVGSEPMEPLFERRPAPRVDAATNDWVAAIADAARVGSALHLGLRCRRSESREVEDFCNLLAEAGLPVLRLMGQDRRLTAGLVSAELHAPPGAVVVVGGLALAAEPVGDDDEFEAPGGDDGRLDPKSFVAGAMTWLARLRSVHVWPMPSRGEPGPAFHGFLGGCVGPIRYDREWSRSIVREVADGVGAAGAAALTERVGDPRDAGAMAVAARHMATARARSGNDPDVDAACATVAGSFAERSAAGVPLVEPAGFDPRLLACDPDALALLRRAGAAAANGARVLAWGSPGGGKSTYAQALAVGMARASTPPREVIVITPAAILAKPLGATERIMEAMWARAANAAGGAVLLVDELDAMCGVRDPGGGSSGNAYLVRVLTDQWLRCLDLHPGVPVVATVNDRNAVDAAVLRRFHLALEFGGELSPEAERLAWTLILKVEPPPGWKPCGAAVADVASAAVRCRMLGVEDGRGVAAAIVKARSARTGVRPRSAVISSPEKPIH